MNFVSDGSFGALVATGRNRVHGSVSIVMPYCLESTYTSADDTINLPVEGASVLAFYKPSGELGTVQDILNINPTKLAVQFADEQVDVEAPIVARADALQSSVQEPDFSHLWNAFKLVEGSTIYGYFIGTHPRSSGAEESEASWQTAATRWWVNIKALLTFAIDKSVITAATPVNVDLSTLREARVDGLYPSWDKLRYLWWYIAFTDATSGTTATALARMTSVQTTSLNSIKAMTEATRYLATRPLSIGGNTRDAILGLKYVLRLTEALVPAPDELVGAEAWDPYTLKNTAGLYSELKRWARLAAHQWMAHKFNTEQVSSVEQIASSISSSAATAARLEAAITTIQSVLTEAGATHSEVTSQTSVLTTLQTLLEQVKTLATTTNTITTQLDTAVANVKAVVDNQAVVLGLMRQDLATDATTLSTLQNFLQQKFGYTEEQLAQLASAAVSQETAAAIAAAVSSAQASLAAQSEVLTSLSTLLTQSKSILDTVSADVTIDKTTLATLNAYVIEQFGMAATALTTLQQSIVTMDVPSQVRSIRNALMNSASPIYGLAQEGEL